MLRKVDRWLCDVTEGGSIITRCYGRWIFNYAMLREVNPSWRVCYGLWIYNYTMLREEEKVGSKIRIEDFYFSQRSIKMTSLFCDTGGLEDAPYFSQGGSWNPSLFFHISKIPTNVIEFFRLNFRSEIPSTISFLKGEVSVFLLFFGGLKKTRPFNTL